MPEYDADFDENTEHVEPHVIALRRHDQNDLLLGKQCFLVLEDELSGGFVVSDLSDAINRQNV